MNDNIVFTVEPEDEPVVMHISEVEVKKGPRGDDGFSPVIETEQLENGYKVTITDAEGPHEFFIYNGENGKDGTKGDKGDTGNGISRVELNSDYTLTFYFTDADPWTTPISIRGKSGADGKDGTNGEDGFSPMIEITSIENGRHIVITDKTGPHSFDILNGHNGEDGTDGEDGFSPSVNILDIENGHRVVLTDKTGPHSFDILNGKDGTDGLNGTTFTPHVSSEGDLSWSNADGKVNPETVNIKGPEGKSAYESAVEAGFEGTEEEFNEYLSGIDDLTNEVTDQKSALNTKAGILRDTVSGAIASFTPDATIPNLLGVSVDIEPVQDLHGYDAPWPAGGGVNKFDVGAVTSADFSISDGTFTNTHTDTRAFFQLSVQQLNNGAYVKSVAAYSAANTGRIFAKISGIEAGITSLIIKHNGSTRDLILCNYPWTGTDDLWISLNIVSNNTTVAGGLVISDIQLEIATAGSTQASAYTPYSNECPISGWDSVDIWNKPTHDTTLPPAVTIQLGQTVYGGTLTISEDGSVKALVDTVKAIADGTIAPTSSSTHSASFLRIFPEAAGYTLATTALKCNRLKPSNYSSANDNLIFFSNAVIVSMRVSEEVTGWVSWLRDNPVEFSYKIANPITIQLDPVTIAAIAGQTNNVWTDAGDVSVEFAADLKHYIDSKIAAAVAALS